MTRCNGGCVCTARVRHCASICQPLSAAVRAEDKRTCGMCCWKQSGHRACAAAAAPLVCKHVSALRATRKPKWTLACSECRCMHARATRCVTLPGREHQEMPTLRAAEQEQRGHTACVAALACARAYVTVSPPSGRRAITLCGSPHTNACSPSGRSADTRRVAACTTRCVQAHQGLIRA